MAGRMIEDVDGELVEARPRAVAHDCYVVATDDIAPIVRGFVSSWKRQRPSDAGRRSKGGLVVTASSFVGPYSWLEQESGVDASTIRDIARGSRRRRFTPVAEAEAILVVALERPDIVRDLAVIEHPDGCRGSLTGDGKRR